MGAERKDELARDGAGLIAADVGGTHARVALLDLSNDSDRFAILHYRKYACADFASLADILGDFRATVPGARVDRIALALAGTTIDDEVVNVNLPWKVSVSSLRSTLGVGELSIVNDFEAVAHAIGHFDASGDTRLSGPAHPALPGPVLIVGPGTGLGAALRIPSMPRPVILATETGQATLAPETDIEFELLRILRGRFSRVQIEHVLSGNGLVNVHGALATLRGVDAPVLTPAGITSAALGKSDALAVEAVDVFCGWLGGVLGDLALLYGAQGGVHLAGGVLPQMKSLLVASTFVERFLDKGVMRPVLSRTPVRLVEHAQLGVVGAASWYLATHPHDVPTTRERSRA